MLRFRTFVMLATAGVMATACSRGMQGAAAGEYIDPVEAAKTVVLDVKNEYSQPMELRVIVNDQSYFVGSVGAIDSTSVLLDPRWFPAGFVYVVGIPADARGRAIAGPLSASKGDRIRFTIQPALDLSRAVVIR